MKARIGAIFLALLGLAPILIAITASGYDKPFSFNPMLTALCFLGAYGLWAESNWKSKLKYLKTREKEYARRPKPQEIRYSCPHCNREYHGFAESAGTQFSCRKCGREFTIEVKTKSSP